MSKTTIKRFLQTISLKSRMSWAATMTTTIGIFVALTALPGQQVTNQAADMKQDRNAPPESYASQIIGPSTAASQSSNTVPGIVIPHWVHLHSSIDAGGTTHYASVEVTLKPGSNAIVMCVGATSGNPANVPGACTPITPSYPGGTVLPNLRSVPVSQRRTLIEAKSGKITLGCQGQGASSCEADIFW